MTIDYWICIDGENTSYVIHELQTMKTDLVEMIIILWLYMILMIQKFLIKNYDMH